MSMFAAIIEKTPGLIDTLADPVSGIPVAFVRTHKLLDLLRVLKSDGYTFLKDMNAVDHLGTAAEKRFIVYYLLYSPSAQLHCMVKVALNEHESIPSVTPLWCGANWQERQIYDLFGISFDGHPSLSRIIMMEGFEGHPMRKDFPITGGNGLALIKDILLPDPVNPER